MRTFLLLFTKGIAEIQMNRPHAKNSLGKLFVNEVSKSLSLIFNYVTTVWILISVQQFSPQVIYSAESFYRADGF